MTRVTRTTNLSLIFNNGNQYQFDLAISPRLLRRKSMTSKFNGINWISLSFKFNDANQYQVEYGASAEQLTKEWDLTGADGEIACAFLGKALARLLMQLDLVTTQIDSVDDIPTFLDGEC